MVFPLFRVELSLYFPPKCFINQYRVEFILSFLCKTDTNSCNVLCSEHFVFPAKSMKCLFSFPHLISVPVVFEDLRKHS